MEWVKRSRVSTMMTQVRFLPSRSKFFLLINVNRHHICFVTSFISKTLAKKLLLMLYHWGYKNTFSICLWLIVFLCLWVVKATTWPLPINILIVPIEIKNSVPMWYLPFPTSSPLYRGQKLQNFSRILMALSSKHFFNALAKGGYFSGSLSQDIWIKNEWTGCVQQINSNIPISLRPWTNCVTL